MLLISLLIGISGFFLSTFFTKSSIDSAANAKEHSEVYNRLKSVEKDTDYLIQDNKETAQAFMEFKKEFRLSFKEFKEDKSIVTKADQESEETIKEIISVLISLSINFLNFSHNSSFSIKSKYFFMLKCLKIHLIAF